jgi:hypothetical protein
MQVTPSPGRILRIELANEWSKVNGARVGGANIQGWNSRGGLEKVEKR